MGSYSLDRDSRSVNNLRTVGKGGGSRDLDRGDVGIWDPTP